MNPENYSSLQRTKIALLMTTPLLASCILSIFLITSLVSDNQEQQSQLIGDAIAKQLSASVSEYMLAEDRLSLTVLLNELVDEGVFSSATIYGADNHLVAAAGKAVQNNDRVFTAEITYQDSVAGYVHISLAGDRLFLNNLSTILIVLGTNLALILLVGFYAFNIADKLTQADSEDTVEAGSESSTNDKSKKGSAFSLPIIKARSRPDRKSVPEITDFDDFSLLVLKIRPTRILEELRTGIKKAVSLYEGRIESFDEEEITVLFTHQTDHCFQAACAALVIQSLTREIKYGECKAGMDCGSTIEELSQARKHASYYASVADNELLVSESVYRDEAVNGKVEITTFHSSMAPDSHLYRISGLIDSHQRLINSQAHQLADL